jgi:hypothetical protein
MASDSGVVKAADATEVLQAASNDYLDSLRQKILFGLRIYPYVNPSMLHVFLGTSTPSSLWKDLVLAGLIEEGLVVSETVTLTSPFDRSQSYTVLHLTENAYNATATATFDPQPRAALSETPEPSATAA